MLDEAGPLAETQALESVAGALDGRLIFVTGATGFLGTALVERLLRSVPGCRIAVLIRPTRRSSAADRAKREIVRNDCFDRLRGELGAEFEAVVSQRLQAVAGDVSSEGLGLDEEGRSVLASADIVVHSAAAVAFDAPIDTAVEVNLLGPSRVAAAISALAGRRATEYPDLAPTHLVSVSTAYVAGTHQGHATETLATDAMRSGARARTHTTVTTEVDIDSEINAARRVRTDLEAESRTPTKLTKIHQRARTELAQPARTFSPSAPRSCVRTGYVRDSSTPVGLGHRRSVGPTPTRSRRPSARGSSSPRILRSPQPSFARRSSSQLSQSPGQVGSGAFAWPSRSSSRMPGAC